MLVPENRLQEPSRAGTDERISDPGAATSGFIRSDTGVGPADEKLETTSARPDWVVVTEATVMAFAVLPGEPTDPSPKSSKSFPAEMTGTTLYTVSRILSQWEAQGLVETGRERVVIRRPHGLVVIADDLPEADQARA